MILFPNAKINVRLIVEDQRDDGYHNIRTSIYPIPIYDILEILPAEEFKFQSSGLELDPTDNLVVKAFQLMHSKHNIGNVFIHLHKQIPLGAGLGGGSADAAFCLKGLNELFELKLSIEQLEEIALELGSDCPFFIQNTPAYVKGRGEIIEPKDSSFSGRYLKVIYPDIHISTKEAFENVIRDPYPDDFEFEMKNDFENWAFQKYPELHELKEQLYGEGAFIASMSGSGSAIYGLFHKKPEKTTSYEFEKIMLLE